MRIIFTTWAWPSHLYAMVPLAWACRAAGHEVLVSSQPELTETILRTGLNAGPVGHDVDAVAVFRALAQSPPGPPSPRPKGTGGPRVLSLLRSLAEAMTDDLAALARRWRADLIVSDPTAFAGPLAAAALGIPSVRHLYGTDLMSVVGRFLPDAIAPLRDELGLDEVDPFGAATIDPCPGRLQVPIASRRLPMRYVPYNGPGVAPRDLPARTSRPRVCVTWGTTMSRLDPGLFRTGQVARTISDLDVDVVAAVTSQQRAMLGPLPPGVQIVADTPLHLILPGCDLVVSHGGAGTLLTALAHGLPQLLVPRLPDHVRHAGRLAETGAATVVPVPDREAIRDRLAELLTAPSYRSAAEALGHEMRAQPSPAQVVRELELVATGVGATAPPAP
ncbi:nucleotide disphospho-sugar-binding domain-containing protein [Actinomadura sp. 9N407]|uniref:nucleotide disphospho-sugar-binding domain-containing protein n=1 Tax=Actinomadura sp. 9N407 TaxID=3375154 RepID=UPI003797B33A